MSLRALAGSDLTQIINAIKIFVDFLGVDLEVGFGRTAGAGAIDLFIVNGKLWAELITKSGKRLGCQSVEGSDRRCMTRQL